MWRRHEVILINVAKAKARTEHHLNMQAPNHKNISMQNMPSFAYIFDFGFPCYLNMQLEIVQHCLLRCHAARSHCHWS